MASSRDWSLRDLGELEALATRERRKGGPLLRLGQAFEGHHHRLLGGSGERPQLTIREHPTIACNKTQRLTPTF